MELRELIGFKRLIISQIVVLLLLSISAYRASHSSDSIIQTYEIKDKVQNLLQKMSNAETFQRGIVITHEDKYLSTYDQEKSKFRKELAALLELESDYKEQLVRVGKIDSLGKKKFLEMDLILQMEECGDYERVVELIKEDYGKAYMDEIRVIVTNLIAEQDQLLRERKIKGKIWNYIILAFFLVSFFVVGYSTYKLQMQLTPLVDEINETRDQLKHVNDNLSESLYKYKKLYEESKKGGIESNDNL